MKNLLKLALFISCLISTINLNAQCCEAGSEGACCVEGQQYARASTPIGIMGDHYHHKSGLMLSYRYMNMAMNGNRADADEITNEAIFSDFMLVPEKMDMQMHMLGLMYAVSNKFTLAVMANYQKNKMNLISRMGMEHYHGTAGFGDVKVNGILGITKQAKQSFHLNMGINIPVGEIDKAEPMSHEGHTGGHHLTKLPYPMQLGSGTWDAQFGATWLLHTNKLTWGVQPMGTFRTGENSEGYRWGNQYTLNTWLAYSLNDKFSVSARLKGLQVEEMTGMDSELMPMMSPTTNAANFGGQQVHGFLGTNFTLNNGLTLGVEFGLPFYQNYNGIQMNQKNSLTAGLKYTLF